jgi:hypothetical protein
VTQVVAGDLKNTKKHKKSHGFILCFVWSGCGIHIAAAPVMYIWCACTQLSWVCGVWATGPLQIFHAMPVMAFVVACGRCCLDQVCSNLLRGFF